MERNAELTCRYFHPDPSSWAILFAEDSKAQTLELMNIAQFKIEKGQIIDRGEIKEVITLTWMLPNNADNCEDNRIKLWHEAE